MTGPLERLREAETLLTAEELAPILKVSQWRVYDLVKKEGLPSIRLGRAMRFDPAAVADWLEERGGPEHPEESGA